MALFLTESAPQVAVMSLFEAQLGLIDAIDSISTLNEALLRADFVIHEQSRLLSEADQEAAKEGFLKKAGGKIKEVAQKVKVKVQELWAALVAKLKNLWARISGKDKELSVPKGAMEKIDALVKALEEHAAELAKDHADVAALNTAMAAVNKKFDDLLTEAQALASSGARESVKPASLNKVNAIATRFAALGNSSARTLDKQAGEAMGPQTPEGQKKMAVIQKSALYATGLATRASKVAALLMKVVGLGSEATPEEKK